VITQDKNHILWNKNHIPPHRVFPSELSFFDWKTSETLGTHHLLWMWFLNVWDNIPMDSKYVCQQYFTCTCFLSFIRYNKTLIACGFRNYEILFIHEYHIPLGCSPQWIWYSWVNTFSYFPHQHAINVYCSWSKMATSREHSLTLNLWTLWEIHSKIFSAETTGSVGTKLGHNSPWIVPFQNCVW
jgi:hypothetical protein